MSPDRRAHAALAALLAATACGGGEEAPPDAAEESALTCETAGDLTGDAVFELRVGLRGDDGQFQELLDDDQCPVITGAQGLLMLLLDLRASFPIPEDSICLDCTIDVSPVEGFGGITQPGVVVFRRDQGTSYSGYSTVILGSAVELSQPLEGAAVEVSVACAGHGYAESLLRGLQLDVQP